MALARLSFSTPKASSKEPTGLVKPIARKALSHGSSNSDPATEKNNIEAVYLYTGIITLQNKKYPEALALLEKALASNKTTKNLKSKENILLQLSKCYKGMRNFDQAYSYLEEYHLLKMHLAEIISAKQNQENFKQFKRDEAYKAIIKKNKEQQQE